MAEPRHRPWRAAWSVSIVALVTTPLAGHAEPQPQSRTALVEAARAALRRKDGIDAEMKLRAALSRGVPREQIAAYMGAAFIRQDDRQHARDWLGPGVFSAGTAAEGFRVLAQLEQLDDDLPAAARAYDRVLAITPNDPGLWVEIGRLRYRAGQQSLAIEAADRAMALDPRDVRALEYRGELVRDRFGMLAALPWFEAAIARAPNDISVLNQYAATLGELGRASEMLVITRRLLQLEPGNAKAYYLQAVLAARAAHYDVARQLLARTRGKLDTVPGAILLEAVLELSAGNTQTASELCERLLEHEPDDMHARQLLARALYDGGQYRYLTLRFRDDLTRNDASPYLLTMIARAFEAIGDRVLAGQLLDRAALPTTAALRVVPVGSRVGALMAQGLSEDALATAERDRAASPGSYETQAVAGDVQLALGHPAEAQQRYALAARMRMSDSLLQRRFKAFAGTGDAQGAARMVGEYLHQNPGNRTAMRLQATLAAGTGAPLQAGAILDYLRRTGSKEDVQLLSDLALVRLQSGDAEAGEQSAAQAYRLQRGNPVAAQALALSYATLQIRSGQALSLLDKARQMLGDNPLLAQARERLGSDRRIAQTLGW